MDITCVSDLHGSFPKLESGDLLIIAGDLTAADKPDQYSRFFDWLQSVEYKKIILIGGNHDNMLQKYSKCYEIEHLFSFPENGVYLCDSGTEFEGLKIWGSPWSMSFEGMNPACGAFVVDTEEELAEKFALIPDDVDILVTHSPPFKVLDAVDRWDGFIEHVGSIALEKVLSERIRPKLHVYGHIHEGYGQIRPILEPFGLLGYPIFVNASIMDEHYKPVNKPIRVIL